VTLPPFTPEVIPALLGLLGQTRQSAGVELEQIVQRLPFPANRSEVERWETGGAWPTARRLDSIVAVYAAATGSVVAALWGEALTRAIMLQGDLENVESPPLD
jgi:transcriptional regulator with XRE-family HTH domain